MLRKRIRTAATAVHLLHHLLVVSSLLGSELGLQSTLLLEVGSLVLGVLLHGLLLSSTSDSGVGVQLVHDSLVAQRVGLLGVGNNLLGRAHHGLHLIGVDDAVDVSSGHDVLGKSVQRVHLLEGSLRPDEEATDVTTGSHTQEVQAGDVAELHTGQVSEGKSDSLLTISVHHHGSQTSLVAAVSHLALSTADLLALSDLLHILIAASLLQESNGLLGLLHLAHLIGNNEGDLTNLVDLVTASHDEGGNGSSSQSRHDSISLLVGVDSAVPLSPDLGGGEHATLAAHVSEGSLTRSRGTSSRHTGDTSDGSSGTPGDGRVLVTSALEHSVGLAVVLSHAMELDNHTHKRLLGVDKLHNISTDRGSEHSGQSHGGVDIINVLNRVDRNDRASSLCTLVPVILMLCLPFFLVT